MQILIKKVIFSAFVGLLLILDGKVAAVSIDELFGCGMNNNSIPQVKGSGAN